MGPPPTALFQYIPVFCDSYTILESTEIKRILVRSGLKLEESQLEPLILDNVFVLNDSLVPSPSLFFSNHFVVSQKT